MAVKSRSLPVTINLLQGFYETAMIDCFFLFIIDIATLLQHNQLCDNCTDSVSCFRAAIPGQVVEDKTKALT